MRTPLKAVVAAALVLALIACPGRARAARAAIAADCPSDPQWAHDLCFAINASIDVLTAKLQAVLKVVEAIARAIEAVANLIDDILRLLRSHGKYKLHGSLSLDDVQRLVSELLPHMPNAMAELSTAFQNPDKVQEWLMQQWKAWEGDMPGAFREVHRQLLHGWTEESPDTYKKSLAVDFADPGALLRTLTEDLLRAVPEDARKAAERLLRSLTDPAHALVDEEGFLEKNLLDVAARHLLPLDDAKADPEKFRRTVRDLFDALSLQRARTDVHQTIRTIAEFETNVEKRMSKGDLTLEEYMNYTLQASIMSARAAAQTAEMTRIVADRTVEASTPPPAPTSALSEASAALSGSLAEDFKPREQP
jgi:signal transduction histidine kinase